MKSKNSIRKYKSYQYPKNDREILTELSDPNYEGGSFVLPSNASPLEKSKYEICQNIVTYHLDNEFTIEETAERIQLSSAETKRLLLYRTNEFTLDRLITYATNLGINLQITEIPKKPKRNISSPSNSRKSSRNTLLAKRER